MRPDEKQTPTPHLHHALLLLLLSGVHCMHLLVPDPISPFRPTESTCMQRITDANAIEIKVLYVRIVSSAPAPAAIAVVFHAGEAEEQRFLTVNGKAAALAPAVVLARARVDAAAGESDYVSTDCVRFTGGRLGFEIKVEGDRGALVVGSVEKTSDRGWGWGMRCCEDGGGGLRFLMDVYFVGRSMGRAVLLNRVLEEGIRKDQSCSYKNVGEHKKVVGSEEELGELSWFGEGVRVGMGLGFAMCLGAGVGVSLVMRSYQAAAIAFKRFL